MTGDRLRVLALAIASITMVVLATLVMDWFVATIAELEVTKLTFDLREARACNAGGICVVVPMNVIKGSFYPECAAIAFWGSLIFAVLVLYQAGSRLFSGFANDTVSKIAHALGSISLVSGAAAGYLFGPDLDSAVVSIDRSWGPLTLLVGLLLGHVAIYFTKELAADDVPYKPIENLPVAHMRTKAGTGRHVPLERPKTTPPMNQRPPSAPPLIIRTAPTTPPLIPRAKTTPPVAQPRTQSSPIARIPDHCKGKVHFAIVTAEVTVAGIDARREDGSAVLVMWRDVVGIVARRLPADLDGAPFVDIVSTAGMTLRILPWTRITGEAIAGTGEDRARAITKLVAERCKQPKLDRATQAFLDGAKPPAQLSVELLVKHDQALA